VLYNKACVFNNYLSGTPIEAQVPVPTWSDVWSYSVRYGV